jgi:signal transduction histidine kinase
VLPGTGEHGFGILGMQERAEALGGKLVVAQREAGGTVVSLTLPIGVADGRDDTGVAG